VSKLRWSILVLGPLPIVIASITLTRWVQSGDGDYPLRGNHVVSSARGPNNQVRAAEPRPLPRTTASGRLTQSCQAVAADLRPQLGDQCQAIVRPPFVIAGDLGEEELVRWHGRTIGPAARAMAASYFAVVPDEPITVLLFRGEESYNRFARQLFGDEGISVYGYYKPARRTLVMNIGTGGGTLVHELTHALIDFDFPDVPDWFNEGLASLHEQCRFRPDESGIDGLVNWRLPIVQEALERGRLRSLADLIQADDFRGEREGVNYAQARYFCMYMQEQGVLEEFYRRFRSNQKDDPLGYQTVGEVLPERTWDELDADFHVWLKHQEQ
jgi:hypothetical protein